jgi:hypothetical protein
MRARVLRQAFGHRATTSRFVHCATASRFFRCATADRLVLCAPVLSPHHSPTITVVPHHVFRSGESDQPLDLTDLDHFGSILTINFDHRIWINFDHQF